MSQPIDKIPDPNAGNERSHRRHKRHVRHSHEKRSRYKRFTEWVKNNMIKFVAFIFLAAIVYFSIMFYLYDRGRELVTDEQPIRNTNNPIKGILLPMHIFNDETPLQIDFGKAVGTPLIAGTSVSLEELNRGYPVSPMKLIACDNEEKLTDPTKFVLSIEGNRLYATTNFRNLVDGKNAGSIDKERWKSLTKRISTFYSNDSLFEVIDNHGNLMFSMRFTPPNVISVSGYFVGSKCIYVLGDGVVTAEPKVGNYVEKVLAQIKKAK